MVYHDVVLRSIYYSRGFLIFELVLMTCINIPFWGFQLSWILHSETKFGQMKLFGNMVLYTSAQSYA